jgi:succinoglycan biosynthesis transport protein ExoP
MLRRRARLPVLAEIARPAEEGGAWSLRRGDFAGLQQALPQLAERRVVLVSGEGEPPSVAAIALAAAAAATGRRTVLVECDMARPRLAAHVGVAAAPGLHEYLRWEAEAEEVIQPVVLAGPVGGGASEALVCVCGGRPAAKVETLLGLRSFTHMVEKLRAAYELVVLSGPPAQEEPAACVAAAGQADAVVAGFAASAASGRDGRPARAAVARLPVPALGAIAVG